LEDRRIPSLLWELLGRLLEALRRLDPDVEVYLSGTYARGDWLRDSDMDLVIVSRAFDGLDVGSRFALVKRLMVGNFEAAAGTPRLTNATRVVDKARAVVARPTSAAGTIRAARTQKTAPRRAVAP